MDLFNKKTKRLDDFRNRLIWGDNKLVMASLLQEFRDKIDLIYIDPPFDVGADFTMRVPIGDGGDAVEKDQSALEMVAFRDIWGRRTDSYLHTMYEWLTVATAMLSERGSIFIHCDWHVGYFIRCPLDGAIGAGSFRNEIVWYYHDKMQGNVNRFASDHDTILWYTRTDEYRILWIGTLRMLAAEVGRLSGKPPA